MVTQFMLLTCKGKWDLILSYHPSNICTTEKRERQNSKLKKFVNILLCRDKRNIKNLKKNKKKGMEGRIMEQIQVLLFLPY